LGAEIVRLWVASVDFREDVVNSEAIMLRLAENYRKLRNTFRFLLGNLAGFDPARDAVADEELLPVDRYMLARCRELFEKVSGVDGQGGWYGDFQFHRVYHAVNEFCIVELSAFYLDVLKDRLYTFAPQGVERRSAQTVLWRIAEALVRLVAPILTFTSDEVWQYLPAVAGREASVHLARFPKAEELGTADAGLVEDWRSLLAVRDEVLKALEAERKAGKIGKALEASIDISAASKRFAVLNTYKSSLKELFNVAQVELISAPAETILEALISTLVITPNPDADPYEHGLPSNPPPEGDSSEVFVVQVVPASGHKCDRCWNYYPDDSPQHVRQFGPWPNVCGRCADALKQMGYTEDAP